MGMAEQIKELVTIPQALRMYGIGEGRHHRIACPLHGGKDANFAYTDKVYHCWTCGAKGDVIRLVMELHGIGFGQALTRLNADFNLGLTNERPTAKSIAMARKKAEERKADTEKKARHKRIYIAVAETYGNLLRLGLTEEELRPIENWMNLYIELGVIR